MCEEWADVQGYEGLYMVSNLGNVKRLEHKDKMGHTYVERALKPTRAHQYADYKHVHLSKDGVAKWHLIHRLVATAFCSKPEGCDIVNHLDNNPANNRAENLEWTTYKGNMQHASRQGHMKGCPENLKKAQEAHKLAVVATKDGQRFEFPSQKEAAEALGVNRGHIAAACRKEYSYKRVGGYEWEYLDNERQQCAKPRRQSRSKGELIEELRSRMMGNTIMVGRKLSEETKEKLRQCNAKAVIQFSPSGDYLGRYTSVQEAKRTTGISHIDTCCRKERKTAGGYIWRYEDEKCVYT